VADSKYWRRPRRRDEERKRFTRLMQEVERIRLREGMTKTELARELGTRLAVIQSWLNGTAIGRKARVKRIKAFLKDQPKRSDRDRNA
jgi:ribosome-binding protein aMBF1 (putative translation factor)